MSEKSKEYQRKRYRERYEKGLCCYCDEPRERNHWRCAIHREITSDQPDGAIFGKSKDYARIAVSPLHAPKE